MRALACLLLAALALAGCGGSSDDDEGGSFTVVTVPSTTPTVPAPPPGATDDAIIRAWADRLRGGDPKGAAELFGVPTIVQGSVGGPVERLSSREAIEAFNAALPCGGVVLKVTDRGDHSVALFRLSHRPGATCDGPGGTARTAFVIEDGRITHWLRLPDAPGDQDAQPTPPADEPLV